MKMRKSPKSILITGASSGIGQALAESYAKADVELFLSGRNSGRLEEVAINCQALGANVFTKQIDVCDEDAMMNWINEVNTISALDLVIANAGISAGSENDENYKKTRDVFKINLDGVLNTIHPAILNMHKQQVGQIAIVSSFAGYRGLPSAPAYSASKAAVKAYGEALRGQLAPENINITVICPGFIRSRITDANDFTMPFFMEADKAAEIIKSGLIKNKALIAFPWQMRLISYFFAVLPSALAINLLSRFPSKK